MTFTPHGKHLIAGEWLTGEGTFRSSPAHGPVHEFSAGTVDLVDRAVQAAEEAFLAYSATSREERARFLEAIADQIEARADAITAIGTAETGLPEARLNGERGRTTGQLRLFAEHIRKGDYLDRRHDEALPDRLPLPRPDIRLMQRPIGPVAVFGASNFPLAFSVAGGDTASALAAGCPVIVKAHSAHPGTSELVGRAVQRAVKECEMPEGTFSLLFDSGRSIGQGLVADHRIKAAGFTGSRAGGTALMKIAASRPEPIPVYAEMSSINPVLLFPGALAARGEAIGKAFVAALTMGAGQFCTNPGLILAVDNDGLNGFVEGAKAALASAPAATMLTPGIHKAYCEGVSRLKSHSQVKMLGEGTVGERFQGQAALFSTTSEDFLKHPELQEEVFGSSSTIRIFMPRDYPDVRGGTTPIVW